MRGNSWPWSGKLSNIQFNKRTGSNSIVESTDVGLGQKPDQKLHIRMNMTGLEQLAVAQSRKGERYLNQGCQTHLGVKAKFHF